MPLIESNAEINQLLDQWEKENSSPSSITNIYSILTRMSEVIEECTEAYFKTDPDPFDDRHPCRARPHCALGMVLKNLFKNDEFMNKLVNNYLMHKDDIELQTHASRLMLNILPGLETSVVFKEAEGLVTRLFELARNAPEPLKSYATGLLAASMEVQDIAVEHKDQNMQLVPIMLKRLSELRYSNTVEESKQNGTVFAEPTSPEKIEEKGTKRSAEKDIPSPALKRRRISNSLFVMSPTINNECSNSSWADLEPYMIGSFRIYPLTQEMQQKFIFQYLTPMGDYQELLIHVFANDALSIIKHYIDLKENKDVRVAFEALKYLATLLCHKKFALEFLNSGGLEQLLRVYRPSVAATGVSMCLYYLGYNEDAMEKICLLPRNILSDLVSYALWLLECSHDSSRCHATMFFSLTFAFRVILDLFDSKDGLRKLLNVIFLLDIFDSELDSTDDEFFTKRQTARQVCVALRRYYEAHLVIEVENIRRSPSSFNQYPHSALKSNSSNIPPYKAAHYSPELIDEYMESLLEMVPLRSNWKPVDELIKLGGVKLLISLIAHALDWNYTGKGETIKSALDVIVVCSITPKFRIALTENIRISEERSAVAISVILSAAEPEIPDPDVQRSALHVLINCVCGPTNRIPDISRINSSTSKRKSIKNDDLISKMWDCVRVNNGIMILLNLLSIKTPITHADSIRALACKALCGLVRSETVKQIISKLSLFTSGQLQALMKEPVLQDKRVAHIKFCKYCLQLIESVTGSPLSTNLDISPANLTKAEVVAQTKIVYNEKELLQLIYQYLMNKGYNASAGALLREASLPISSAPRSTVSWGATPIKISRVISSSSTHHSPSVASVNSNFISSHSSPSISSNCSSTSKFHTPSTSSAIPMKIYRHSSKVTPQKNLIKQKPSQGHYQPSPVMKRLSESHPSQAAPSITLDSIVTEYLRKQHALCKNPVVTCPPFDLFVPHRCPEPLNRHSAPLNMTMRLLKREITPRFGGMFGTKFDRKFIYSRFRPLRTYRDTDDVSGFTSCAFSHVDQYLFLGTAAGELAVFNLYPGALETTYPCHESDISYIEPSRDGKFILTCSIWLHPLSVLWTFTDLFEMKMSFQNDQYVEFSKQVQDKVLGTANFAANLYDINTGQLVHTFEDKNLSNKYSRNRATFSPTDELILNDGVLWDVRSSTAIHKFDKFNQSINGVFHPNGWEIVSNSEIWDLRTYHLLKTVPALDQCRIKFNQTGDVIYGAMFEEETSEDDELNRSPFGSSFRTFDSSDYSNIATIDVKKSISDLAVDPGDNFVAVIENQRDRDHIMMNSESLCRLYEVGRNKEEDDADAEEEEEEDNDLDDDSDDENLEHDEENTDDINQGSNDSDNISLVSTSDEDVAQMFFESEPDEDYEESDEVDESDNEEPSSENNDSFSTPDNN